LQIADCSGCSIAPFCRHQEQPRRQPVSAVSPAEHWRQPDCAGEAAWPKTFDEEKATDQKLTALAEGKVDIRAAS